MIKRFIFFLVIILLTAMCGSGCKSTGTVPETIGAAGEYRDIEKDIWLNQTDLAITGERIQEVSRSLAEGLTVLETTVITAPENRESRENIVLQVQILRALAEDHQAEAKKLTGQLTEERANYRLLSKKFNEYDQKAMTRLSEKDKELTAIKMDNKKLAGQRNTLLAIVITAISVAMLFVAFKVLRFFKVIPF